MATDNSTEPQQAADGRPSEPAPTAAPPRPRIRRGPQAMAELKQQLLEHARRIHCDEGPAALSMRRLAQEAGLSTMALYSYFPNKRALLEGLWRDVFDALLEQLLAAAQPDHTPLQTMKAHLHHFIGFWEARPEQFRMIYMSAPPSPEEKPVPIEEQPTYGRLIRLERERVAACAHGWTPGDDHLGEVSALALAKGMGYLLLVLGIPRYPLPERSLMRERIIADALRGIEQGLSRLDGEARND